MKSMTCSVVVVGLILAAVPMQAQAQTIDTKKMFHVGDGCGILDTNGVYHRLVPAYDEDHESSGGKTGIGALLGGIGAGAVSALLGGKGMAIGGSVLGGMAGGAAIGHAVSDKARCREPNKMEKEILLASQSANHSSSRGGGIRAEAPVSMAPSRDRAEADEELPPPPAYRNAEARYITTQGIRFKKGLVGRADMECGGETPYRITNEVGHPAEVYLDQNEIPLFTVDYTGPGSIVCTSRPPAGHYFSFTVWSPVSSGINQQRAKVKESWTRVVQVDNGWALVIPDIKPIR